MTSNLIDAPLDRAAWYRSLVSIIITHYNYSDFIADAIRSVLDRDRLPHDEQVVRAMPFFFSTEQRT